MLEHAKNAGDLPERLRRIRHVTYFTSERMSRKFVKNLASNGFIDVEVMKFIGEPLWRVDFFRVGNATLPNMAHWDCITKKMAEKAGGEYDGCEFPIMTTDVPDELLQPERDCPSYSIAAPPWIVQTENDNRSTRLHALHNA
ncbi:regulator of ribonuclease activity B family protein [Burkholderia pseudomallei MSHR456]|nr:regulator of ribonuclease activity B family protein [Burkholderia pseudomallei MSHR456]